MGLCTSKGVVVISQERNQTPMTYRPRGSEGNISSSSRANVVPSEATDKNETNKETLASNIRTESKEQIGGTKRGDANNTVAQSISLETDEDDEDNEEKNSEREGIDVERNTEIISLHKSDDFNSKEDQGNGVDSEKLFNEDGRHSFPDTIEEEMHDDNDMAKGSLTFIVDTHNDIKKIYDNSIPPADTKKTENKVKESEESDESSDRETSPHIKEGEGKRNTEEQESTKSDDVYEDPRDHPGGKQRREPDQRTNKKNNLVRNVVRVIERPEIVQALVGNMDIKVPSQSRIVRIFISSTFTDTKNERNILMKKAYPQLKAFCQKLGYEFQVVDMRWGIRDKSTDNQTGTELCLNEIKLCQTLSTGPCFVSLVSHKYGYRLLPRTIESNVLEQIMLEIENKGNKDALQYFKKWYRRDENAVPHEHVLAPITSHFPDHFSSDEEKKKQSNKAYNQECEVMISALEETEAGVEYSKSVTEVETRFGLLDAEDPSKHCVWFQRTIEGIEDQKTDDILPKYLESGDAESKWKRSRELLAKMKNDMTTSLTDDGILKYTVHWDTENGINPENTEHDKYLQKLADDFEKHLSSMIKEAVQERVHVSDPVVEEVHQHIKFCKAKCATFYGRYDPLKTIREYIASQSTKPMVVYGVSGCGKTSLMAKAAYLAREWTKDKAAVILRFIGTSQRSTTIRGLLQSVTQQIKRIYRPEITVPQNIKAIEEDFKKSLGLANASMPLILVLDSLDQLDPADNARQLKWLPEKLPDHCKVILSTLPDENYQCYPILKNSIKNKNNFLEVKPMPKDDIKKVIDIWLKLRNRTITAEQMDRVLQTYEKCSLPLFLKLSFEEAIGWNSFSDENVSVLCDTVKKSIDTLFEKLEVKHGTMLTSRALGYLTVSQNGITEAELEDILSCDDDVLNDVYKYWTPPIRRLPPLLLVRLKTDLEQYLVERDADGSRVFYWYHRQFKETAEETYCSGKEVLLNTGLADFFSGRWADDHPKPVTYIAKKDNGDDEKRRDGKVRFVSAQPLDENNLRKLNNLPFHRLKAGQQPELKEQCLCNFSFLLIKLRATNLWSVMDDFVLARSKFPEDEAIKMIDDVLQISQDSLLYDPGQLPVQMILRLESKLANENKDTRDFLDQCRTSGIPYLLPDKNVLLTPGGQLVHSMAGHKEKSYISSVDVSKDGQHTVTCGDDETVRIWNNVDGRQVCKYETEWVQKTFFCLDDAFLLINLEDKLVVKNKSTGIDKFKINLDAVFSWCLCGPGREYLVLFKDNVATTYNLETQEQNKPVECKKKVSFTSDSEQSSNDYSVHGSERYAVALSIHKTSICLFDVSEQQFGLYYNVCHDSNIQKDDVHSLQWAITNNETCIAYTSKTSGSIYFLDIRTKTRLRELQVFKEEKNAELLDIQISRDKHYLTFLLAGLDDNSTLVVYNLEKELELSKRKGIRTSFTYASSSNGTTVVTSSEDALVQVWDLTQSEKGQNTITTDKDYQYLQCLPNSRYLLGTYSEGSEEKHHTLFVYDTCERKTVRHATVPTKVDVMISGRDTAIIWPLTEESKTAFLIDLKMMVTVTKLSGLPPMKQCLVYGNGEGLVSWTEEGQITFYRLPSGEKAGSLDVDINCQLHVNRKGSIMTVNGRDMVDIYDRLNNTFLHSIKYNDFGVLDFEGIQLFTEDGKYIIFQVNKIPPKCQIENGTTITYLVGWDVKKEKMVSDLVDSEYYNKYEVDGKCGSLVNLVSAVLFDNNRIIASHEDYIMRLYDVKTGMLQRIEDPGRSMYLQTFEEADIFLSHGYEEDAFRIWDKQTLKPVASFKPDYTVDKVMMTLDERYIVGIDKNQKEIIKWKLVKGAGENRSNPDSYPEDFPGQVDLDLQLDLGIKDKKKDDEDTDDDQENEEEQQVQKTDDNVHSEDDLYSSDDDFDLANDDEQNDQNSLSTIHEDDEKIHEGRDSNTVKDKTKRNDDTNSENDHLKDNILQSTEIRNGKHNINNGKNVDEEALLSDPSSEDW